MLSIDKEANHNPLFLPKHSMRFYFDKDPNNYITTYEALCAQLVQQGKSYKEIGSLLSMGSGTVKTHLTRLKARTGLSLQELSLQTFQDYGNNKNTLEFKINNQSFNCEIKRHKKLQRDH